MASITACRSTAITTSGGNGGILLTRKDMYDKVWSQAMRKLAPDWGLSDVGLKKLCKRFEIPTPPVGYWAKLEFNDDVKEAEAAGEAAAGRFMNLELLATPVMWSCLP